MFLFLEETKQYNGIKTYLFFLELSDLLLELGLSNFQLRRFTIVKYTENAINIHSSTFVLFVVIVKHLASLLFCTCDIII